MDNCTLTTNDFDDFIITMDADCVHNDYEVADAYVHEQENVSITDTDIQFE